MKASPELREKMWELCYDLLPDGERTALIAQIKSDPQVARLYAEVRLQADLVGYASTVEDSSLILSADAEKLKMPDVAPAAGRRKEAAQSPAVAPRGPNKKSLWAANAVAMAAGLALVLVMGVGFFRPQDVAQQVAQLVVTKVEVPGQLTPGLTQDFIVYTSSAAEEPVAVPVDVKLVAPDGTVSFHKEIQTAEDGRGKVEVPGNVMKPGVRLQVEARREEFAEQQVAPQAAGQSRGMVANFVEADLPVTRQEPLAYFLVEKPTAQDGEKIRVAAWGLDRFALVPAAPQVEDVMVTDHDSTQRIQPEWRESIQENMVEGTLDFSRAQPERAWAIDEKSKSQEQLSLLQVERAKSIAAKDAVEDRTFRKLDRASSLSAGASAAPGQGAYRFQVRGVEGNAKSAAATAGDEGRSGIDNVKKDAQQPDDGKQSTAEIEAEKLAAAKQKAAMKRRQVVAADQPIELELSADQAGKKLEAIVRARDVLVVRQRVEPQMERSIKSGKGQEQLAKVWLDVPREVDGNLDVTLFDPSAADGERVYHEYLYRSPARELKFEVLNLQQRYDPGELVKLMLKIVNENNEPQRAAVGIRIWNNDYVPEGRLGLVMLSDVVRQGTRDDGAEIDAAETLGELAQFGRPLFGAADLRSLGALHEDSGKGLLDQLAQQQAHQPLDDLKKQAEAGAAGAPPLAAPLPSGPAEGSSLARSDRDSLEALAMAEDAASGAEGVLLADATTAFAVAPIEGVAEGSQVTVASNKAAIDRQVQSLKSESARALAAWQATVGRVLIGGGLVALSILGLLFAMRMQVRLSSGTLALVAAAASLVVGAVWIGGGRQEMTVAMAPRGGAPGIDATMASPDRALAEARPMAAIRHSRSDAVNEVSPTLEAAAPVADGFAAPELPGLPAASTELSKEPASGPKPLAEETATPLAATAPSAAVVPAVAAPAAAPTPNQDAPAPQAPAPQTSKEKFAADKEADGVKGGSEGELKLISPAKPGPAGGKNVELGSQSGQPGDKNMEKPDAKKQAGGGAAPPAPPATRRSGGFGGGSGRGGLERSALEPGGLGGRGLGEKPNDAPGEPRPILSGKLNDLRAGAAGAPVPTDPARPGSAPTGEGDRDRIVARENRNRDRATAAPSAIYFNPQLATDANGLVTIEFQLPEVASEYRLLIDAYGNGRVGSSAEVRIVCQPAAK